MAKLKNNFEEFHKSIKLSKKDTPQKVRDKRDNIERDFKANFPDLYENKYNEKIEKIEFIHQGSYAIDTVISGNTFDIDYGVIITPHEGFDINEDTKILKNIAKEAIITTNRDAEIKKPCICVTYTSKGEEEFHLDFPIYVKIGENYYLAWGKPTQTEEERVFKEADPYALNDWFRSHLSENQDDVSSLKEEKRQTRRLVRFFKYWKYLNYGESLNNLRNTKEVPPSIALTISTCNNYKAQYLDGNLCDLRSLHDMVKKTWDSLFLEWNDEYISTCNLPTVPNTDTFYKLKDNKSSVKKFRCKLEKFRDKLKEAIDEVNEEKASEILAASKILGEDFPLSEEETKANENGDNFA